MGRNRRKKLDYTFVPIPVPMLESSAWEKLTNPARVAYIHILKKYIFNRYQPVSTTYTEMERFMTRKTYCSAIRQLEENGIIRKTQTGGMFRKRNYFKVLEPWRRINEQTDEGKLRVRRTIYYR